LQVHVENGSAKIIDMPKHTSQFHFYFDDAVFAIRIVIICIGKVIQFQERD